MKNRFAVALGRLAKGKKKTLTKEQRDMRRAQMQHARNIRSLRAKKNKKLA